MSAHTPGPEVVTPHKYNEIRRDLRTWQGKAREAIRVWRAIPKARWYDRENAACAYVAARTEREHWRKWLATHTPVKGSAWSEVAQARLRSMGRLGDDAP